MLSLGGNLLRLPKLKRQLRTTQVSTSRVEVFPTTMTVTEISLCAQ